MPEENPKKNEEDKEESSTTPKKSKLEKPETKTKTPDFMSSIFTDKIFFISGNCSKADQLKRYIIALVKDTL